MSIIFSLFKVPLSLDILNNNFNRFLLFLILIIFSYPAEHLSYFLILDDFQDPPSYVPWFLKHCAVPTYELMSSLMLVYLVPVLFLDFFSPRVVIV